MALSESPAVGPRLCEGPPGKAPRRCDATESIGEERKRGMAGPQPVEARRGFQTEPEREAEGDAKASWRQSNAEIGAPGLSGLVVFVHESG